MDNLMLNDSQKKTILLNFRELDMHKELKILFEKMYIRDTSVYITHGPNEMGRDLIISIKTPIGIENIAVVVKMDKLSGSASDKILFEVTTQVNQCFEVAKAVKDQFEPLVTDKVIVCIFGEISNKAKDNLNATLRMHKGRIIYFDMAKLVEYFTEYYPRVFLGASGLEALHKKYNELEKKILSKNKLLKTSYIEPNLRMFKKSRNQLLSISQSTNNKKMNKALRENIFGEKETIQSISLKILNTAQNILIEGEAGSGKSIFVLKLTMYIIEQTIKKINVSKAMTPNIINIPIVLKATSLTNGTKLIEEINLYYENNSSFFKANLLIIDGIDEVDKETKEKIIKESEDYCSVNKITLIFTTRKSTEVKKRLVSYQTYELLPFETSQAVEYIKKYLQKNKTLMGALLKGLSQLKHQIPLYPMALSLLIEIAEKQHEVPASISELYKQYIEMSLSQYSDGEQINVLFEPNMKRKFLEELAYSIFYRNNKVVIKREEFDIFLIDYIIRHPLIHDKEAFLSDLNRTTVIKIDEEYVEFLHKSFLDYFIASYFYDMQVKLLNKNEFNDIYTLYHTSQWEDVTLFYFGRKTIIEKSEIDSIIAQTPPEHDGLLAGVSKFMIGKLVQYAWYTDANDKKYAISLAIENILDLRSGLIEFVEADLSMPMPKILGDIQMLHFIDESFSSRFLVEEVKDITHNMLTEQIEVTEDIFYFITLFTLENINLLNDELIENYLDFFIKKSDSMPLNISFPLISLVGLFIKNNKLVATKEQKESLEKINHKIKKRHKELAIDYMSFKNKLDQLRIKNIAQK